MKETYTETPRSIEVYDKCDVLVVGSGAAGHSAAIAAARAGCKNIVLMERYGYSGGDVTGGYVIMVPNLSWYDKSFVRGLQEEWFTRLEPIPAFYRRDNRTCRTRNRLDADTRYIRFYRRRIFCYIR